MTGNGGNVGRALGWCGRVFAFGSAAYYVGYFAVWRWEVNRGYFDAPESLVIPAFFLALAFIAACLTIRRHFAVLWISQPAGPRRLAAGLLGTAGLGMVDGIAAVSECECSFPVGADPSSLKHHDECVVTSWQAYSFAARLYSERTPRPS